MNKTRRKEITDLRNELDNIRSQIENIENDEQSYFDEMPENFQYGEKGQIAETAVGNLQEAIEQIDQALDYLDCAAE